MWAAAGTALEFLEDTRARVDEDRSEAEDPESEGEEGGPGTP